MQELLSHRNLKRVHYATINEAVFSTCRAVLSSAALVARQRCDKHITAAANQHATVEQAVFSACPAFMSHDNSG
jgi:spermidine synthase